MSDRSRREEQSQTIYPYLMLHPKEVLLSFSKLVYHLNIVYYLIVVEQNMQLEGRDAAASHLHCRFCVIRDGDVAGDDAHAVADHLP